MQPYQTAFIKLAIEHQVLKFGSFTLKSGRNSPYFFNAGSFYTSKALNTLGKCYAQAIISANNRPDLLFGTAYKGIPLVITTAVALAEHHNIDLPYCFNRKEAKKHGEGGSLVGAPLSGNIAIIDDVITAGTAIREVLELVQTSDAQAKLVVVGLDRQEPGPSGISAIESLKQEHELEVISIVTLEDIITFLKDEGSKNTHIVDLLEDYRLNVPLSH